jgi:hypothetical protein
MSKLPDVIESGPEAPSAGTVATKVPTARFGPMVVIVTVPDCPGPGFQQHSPLGTTPEFTEIELVKFVSSIM